MIRTRKLLVGSEGAVDDKLFRDAKQRLRRTLVEDGPIRRTLKPNKKENGNNGRRSLWRLEASGVTNQRLARIEEGEEDSGMDDLETKRIAERMVSAIENHFRDWLMPGEYQEAVKLVAEVLKRETKE